MKLIKNPEYYHIWEHYASELFTEYNQSLDEGLDVEPYKAIFDEAQKLPEGSFKEEIADAISKLVLELPTREGYKYNEPSDLEGIKALRNLDLRTNSTPRVPLDKKVAGAWYGRISGCLLGKPIEGAWTRTIHAVLKGSNNFPLYRYLKRTDLGDTLPDNARWLKNSHNYIDEVECAPLPHLKLPLITIFSSLSSFPLLIYYRRAISIKCFLFVVNTTNNPAGLLFYLCPLTS